MRAASTSAADDDRAAEARTLLARVDLAALRTAAPAPDRFVYTFDLLSGQAVVHEPDLTPDLHRLAALVARRLTRQDAERALPNAADTPSGRFRTRRVRRAGASFRSGSRSPT